MPRIPAAARLSAPLGRRASTSANTSAADQSTAASAQPAKGQPATAYTGKARRITSPPATVGASRLGIERGVEKMPALTRYSLFHRPGRRRGCLGGFPGQRRREGRWPQRRASSRRARRRASRHRGRPGVTPKQSRANEVRGPRQASSRPEHISELVTPRTRLLERNEANFVTSPPRG